MKKRQKILATLLLLMLCAVTACTDEDTVKNGDAVKTDSIISKYDKPEEPLEDVPAEETVPEEPKTELTAEVYSIDRQIELFAEQVEEWATFKGVWDKPELKDCWFTLTDLDYDGKLDLIVTSQAGSGIYSDNYIYEIDGYGKVTEREVDWGRSDSEPDILVDEMLVYRVSSSEGIRDYYIMDDYIRDGAMYYYQNIRVMCMMDDYLTAKILVRSENYYDEEKDEIIMTCEDADGNPITDDEYWNAADNYFAGRDYQKKTATFAWKHIEDLQGLTEEEVAQVLKESYEGFSVKEPRPELTEEEATALRRVKYQEALQDIYENRIGFDHSIMQYVKEPISNNQFAIYDVDNDGREELIFSFVEAQCTADMWEAVMEYHVETDSFEDEHDGFPLITYCENGLLKEGLSHGAPITGDFWPYTVHSYESEFDSYKQIAYVSAWDKTCADTDYFGNSFPEEVDTEGCGIVFYVTIVENESWKDTQPISKSDYEKWVKEQGLDKELQIPYQNLTEENIAAIQ